MAIAMMNCPGIMVTDALTTHQPTVLKYPQNQLRIGPYPGGASSAVHFHMEFVNEGRAHGEFNSD